MGTGQRIKELTKERGITLKELAEKSGVSYNTIYSITKRDSKRVQGEILQHLSAALCVSPSALLGTTVTAFDDVLGIIVNEYPSASFSSTDNPNTFRVSLGNNSKAELLSAFDKLNPSGKTEAVKRVSELTEIPRYRRPDAQDAAKGTDADLPADAPISGSESPAEGKK